MWLPMGHGLGESVACRERLSHFLLRATFELQHKAASGSPAFHGCAWPAFTTLPPSLVTQSRMVVNRHLSVFTQSHCACTTRTHAYGAVWVAMVVHSSGTCKRAAGFLQGTAVVRSLQSSTHGTEGGFQQLLALKGLSRKAPYNSCFLPALWEFSGLEALSWARCLRVAPHPFSTFKFYTGALAPKGMPKAALLADLPDRSGLFLLGVVYRACAYRTGVHNNT